METSIKIGSLNVRGMRNGLKRRKIFTYVRESDCDIMLLQETHSTKDDSKCWSKEWGLKSFFAHGTSRSCGVSILIKKNQWKISDLIRDVSGRYILCKINIGEDSYCIANIYGPSESDSPEFFVKVFQEIVSMHCDYWILGGGF